MTYNITITIITITITIVCTKWIIGSVPLQKLIAIFIWKHFDMDGPDCIAWFVLSVLKTPSNLRIRSNVDSRVVEWVGGRGCDFACPFLIGLSKLHFFSSSKRRHFMQN